MKQLICEMCNSNELLKVDGTFVCQSCGTKYSVEEAKKMMIDGTVDVQGTVKVDSSDELNNLYQVARRAKADKNYENALKYYDMILVKDPSSWEANFYTTYYQAMNCKIGEIKSAANRIVNCEQTVFNLIKNSVDPLEYNNIIDEVSADLINIAGMLFNAYENHFNGIGTSIKHEYRAEFFAVCHATMGILYHAGDLLVEIFGDACGKYSVCLWEVGVKLHRHMHDTCRLLSSTIYNAEDNVNTIRTYDNKILKYNPSYQAKEIYEGLTKDETQKAKITLGVVAGVIIGLIILIICIATQ